MSQILINNAFELGVMPLEFSDLINQGIENDSVCSSIFILPTAKQVRYYTQKIIRSYYEKYRKPISILKIVTLEEFINNLFQIIFPENYPHIISEAYRLTIIEEATEKLDLKFFKMNNKSLNYQIIEKLTNIIFGLREDGITLEALKNDIDNAKAKNLKGYDFFKLDDIYKLYNYYENSLSTEITDYPDIVYRIINYFSNNKDYDKSLNKAYKDTHCIFINGFSEFKKPEVEIISYLNKINIPIGISIDYSTENGPLFGNLEDTVIQLQKAGYRLIDKVRLKYKNANISEIKAKLSRSEFIRANLFYSKDYQSIQSDSFNNIVLICEAEDRTDEVQSIARLVKHLILKHKIQASEICIAMRNPNKYSILFREQLQRYSIPYNISDRFDLSSSPIIITIFSILNLIIKGFRREDVHLVLTSKYIQIERNEETIDPSNLFNIAKNLRILGGNKRGGADYWKKRIEISINLKERLLANEDRNKEDIFEVEILKKEINNLKKALLDFTILTDSISFENKYYTPAEFYDILFEGIIKRFKIYDKISKYQEEFIINGEIDNFQNSVLLENLEKDARSLIAFKTLVEEFIFIMRDRYPDKKFRLSEYVSKLKTSAKAFRYQIHEKPGYGINITSIEQTRGIPYKALILCGAVDGEFPISFKPEYFLGKELPETEVRHNKSERIQFYQFLTNSTELLDAGNQKLYIFYPKHDGSRELVPSPYINALLKITTLKENSRYIILKEIKKLKKNGQLDYKQKDDFEWIDSISAPFEAFKHFALNYNNTNFTKDKGIFALINQDKNTQHTIEFIQYILEKQASVFNENVLIKIEDIPNRINDKLSKSIDKPYSVTELETYALCPFKYFILYILELKEKKVDELGVSPLEKGNLLHKILYRFYTYQQKQTNRDLYSKIKLVKLNSHQKQEYLATLKSIAEEEIEQVKFDHPFFYLDIDAIIGTNEKRGSLEIWLDNELNKTDWGFEPGIFELAFGIQSSLSTDYNMNYIDLDGLKIRGKIDRIEFSTIEDKTYFLIADYKLNLKNVATNSSIKDGISFQVPLYLLAGKKILKQLLGAEPFPVGGVYYALIQNYDRKSKKYESFKFVLLPQGNNLLFVPNVKSNNQTIESYDKLEEYLHTSLEKAKAIRDKISNGIFFINPQQKACENCSFNSICRKIKQ